MSDPVRILIGDVLDGLRSLPDGSVQCCVTSPPYLWLRDYGIDGQIGLEATPDAYVAKMVDVFREVRRVLRDDGVCFLNLGDSYFGGDGRNRNGMAEIGVGAGKSKPGSDGDLGIRLAGTRPTSMEGMRPKSLMMIPWRVALALQASGWYLRSVIVWAKKSPMPESVTDRPTSSWEPIFLLAKGERYFYDAEAVKEEAINEGKPMKTADGWDTGPGAHGAFHRNGREAGQYQGAVVSGRNQRNVWHLGPEPYREAHFACFPTEIPRRGILAGTSEKGACPDCGAPWRRVVEKKVVSVRRPECGRQADAARSGLVQLGGNNCGTNSMRDGFREMTSSTTGWEPTCKCGNPNTVPCVVLDPFLGSGTTIAVARTLGRHGVGCELNPQYAALARDRIGKAEKPATYVAEKSDDSPLFAGDPK